MNSSQLHTTSYLLSCILCVTELLIILSIISAYLASGKPGFGRGVFVIHGPEQSRAQLHRRGSHPDPLQAATAAPGGPAGPQPNASNTGHETAVTKGLTRKQEL